MDMVTSAVFAGRNGKQHPAWHGKGANLTYAPNREEAQRLAGLLWEPELKPLYLSDGRSVGTQAVVRSDNQGILGTVGATWEPIGNGQLFDFLDSLVETGDATYEAAGELNDGKRVWALLRCPQSDYVGQDDVMERYILAANGHDRTLAFTTFGTSVRVVCQNTLSLAISRAGASAIKIQHRPGTRDGIDKARNVLKRVNRSFDQFAEQAMTLNGITVTTRQAEGYVSDVLSRIILKHQQDSSRSAENDRLAAGIGVLDSILEEAEVAEKGTTSRHGDLLVDILDRFEAEHAAGTAWGAFNAVTEWIDHGRSHRTDDARFNSTILGNGNRMKVSALSLAMGTFAS